MLSVVVLCVLAGCTGLPGEPKFRTGALPFPGPMTFYNPIDDQRLAPHDYDHLAPLATYNGGAVEGILYARRAGFLDLGHIRLSIDWTRYVADRVRDALTRRRESLELEYDGPATFVFAFRYPDDWAAMADDPRRELIRELSIRIAHRAAYQMSVWHEVITWHGFRTFVIVPEMESAFSYEDLVSNLVGTAVGAEALRNPRRNFDLAADAALTAELRRLDVVSKEELAEAVRLVRDKWWSLDGHCLKRFMDTGLDDTSVRPWLVRDLPGAEHADAARFLLPTLRDVMGRDRSGVCTVEIRPSVMVPKPVRALLPASGRFSADADLDRLVEMTRASMAKRLGEGFDRP